MHTKGKWTGDEGFVFDNANFEIAFVASKCELIPISSEPIDEVELPEPVFKERQWEEVEANCKLIAAAPELLEALQFIIDEIDTRKDTGVKLNSNEKNIKDIAFRAIQKATA